MLSFCGDTLNNTNALELGLPKKFCDPFGEYEFIRKQALQKIANEGGPKTMFRGIYFDEGLPPFGLQDWRGKHLPVYTTKDAEGSRQRVGTLTAQAFSPLFQRNLGLGFIDTNLAKDTEVRVETARGEFWSGHTCRLPFEKSIRRSRQPFAI